jgi:hypothetical protein
MNDDYHNRILILEDGRQVEIPMREDGYILATKMCKSAGKRLTKWKECYDTIKFIKLVIQHTNLTENELIDTYKGNSRKFNQGTWVHPKLAIHLAMWLSSSFCLQVSNWIEEWCSYREENHKKFLYEIYNLECDNPPENKEEKQIQLRLHQELGGAMEVETKVGYIDLLTADEIIEIKEGKYWKHAVGQILMYAVEYPHHKKRIHLFNIDSCDLIEEYCKLYDISVSYE